MVTFFTPATLPSSGLSAAGIPATPTRARVPEVDPLHRGATAAMWRRKPTSSALIAVLVALVRQGAILGRDGSDQTKDARRGRQQGGEQEDDGERDLRAAAGAGLLVDPPGAPGAAEQEAPDEQQDQSGVHGSTGVTGYRAPLVDGTSVTRGSIATAWRSARASALSCPSTMWWAPRPAQRARTWRLIRALNAKDWSMCLVRRVG